MNSKDKTKEFIVPGWLKLVIIAVMLFLVILNILSSLSANLSDNIVYGICSKSFIALPVLSILYELKRVYLRKSSYFKIFTIVFAVGTAFLTIVFLTCGLGWFHVAIFGIQILSLLGVIIDRDIYLEKSFLYGMGIVNPAFINLMIFIFRASVINSVINITSLMITNLVIAVFYIFMLYSRYRNSHLKIDNKDDQ